MKTINKSLMRLAIAVHARLSANQCNDALIEMPSQAWQSCTNLVRQIRRAKMRGWHLAAKALGGDLVYAIPSVVLELTTMQNRLRSQSCELRIASVTDLYQDLVALDEEFEALEFASDVCSLSVTTEPIVLHGVYLGPFEIQLKVGRAGCDPSYQIIAKDPHPAESRDNVTHPHVMDQVLCEGDGRHAIRQALSQGRLLDFFTLVAGVLRTYNPESPFVELALWQGTSCSDCGSLVHEDYSYSCHRCGDTVCGECEATCGGCEESYCSSCTGNCAACEEAFCRRCLNTCEGCHRHVCSGCLHENERCINCHEEEPEDVPPITGVEVQPDSLGQAALPA